MLPTTRLISSLFMSLACGMGSVDNPHQIDQVSTINNDQLSWWFDGQPLEAVLKEFATFLGWDDGIIESWSSSRSCISWFLM